MDETTKYTNKSGTWGVRPFCEEYKALDSEVRHRVEKFLSEIPVKLGEMARSLEVKVLLSTLPSGISGQIGESDGKFLIKINRHEARHRQRFTLAHEIAHYLLHREEICKSDGGWCENILLRSGQPLQLEYEANRLAADLIMPPDQLVKRLDYNHEYITEDTIYALSKEFGVSTAAMEIRLLVSWRE